MISRLLITVSTFKGKMTDLDSRMELFTKYLDRTNMEHKKYQYDGVRWCLNNELRDVPPCKVRGGFIADEMGLGKTIMVIGVMLTNFKPKTLIVLPPVLINQWFMQILRTTGHKALVYHGVKKKKITIEELNKACIVLTSYGSLVPNKKQKVKMLMRLLFLTILVLLSFIIIRTRVHLVLSIYRY